MSKTIELKNKIEENIKYLKLLLINNGRAALIDLAHKLIRKQIEILQNMLMFIYLTEPIMLELSDNKEQKE